MTDDEIDTRLRAHGTAWREANHDRPAIDWELVTKRRRAWAWFAVVGVCIAVVAIVVPLVLTTGDNSAGNPVPPVRPSPAPTSAQAGAPPGFFALEGNRIAFVTWTGGQSTIRPAGGKAETLGVAADDKTAYAAYEIGTCRTRIYKVSGRTNLHGVIDDNGAARGRRHDRWRHAGVEPDPPRDGGQPGRHQARPRRVQPACRQRCGQLPGPEQLVVVNLLTHAVRRWSGATGVRVRRRPAVGAGQSASRVRAGRAVAARRLLDTAAAGSLDTHARDAAPRATGRPSQKGLASCRSGLLVAWRDW